MANLLNYIDDCQFDSFYDQPLNRLDILALTEIAYLPFDQLAPYAFSLAEAIRLDQLAVKFTQAFADGYPPLSMVTKERLKLLDKLSKSKRFKHIKVLGFVDDYDLDKQKQFAALCYKICRDTYLVSFRGTDDTIIGWKEDFHMTYMAEIPAQKSASNYLSKLMDSMTGRFYISGHSKGGNLAVYASSQQTADKQEHILKVLTFDAPGVHRSIIESDGFKAIESRIETIIPENSIVGMMLETPKGAHIVQSRAIGLLQHITFSWEIENHDFKPAETLSGNSIQVDKTLKTWTANLSDEELKHFFDTFFGLFIEAGIHRFNDITKDTPQKIQQLIANSQHLTSQEREMVDRLLLSLLDTRYQIWKEDLLQNLAKPQEKIEEWLKPFFAEKKEEAEL